jgi:hypothetical protein
MGRLGISFALLMVPGVAGAQAVLYQGRIQCVGIPHLRRTR